MLIFFIFNFEFAIFFDAQSSTEKYLLKNILIKQHKWQHFTLFHLIRDQFHLCGEMFKIFFHITYQLFLPVQRMPDVFYFYRIQTSSFPLYRITSNIFFTVLHTTNAFPNQQLRETLKRIPGIILLQKNKKHSSWSGLKNSI